MSSKNWQLVEAITNQAEQHRQRMKAIEAERLENEANDKNASYLSRLHAQNELRGLESELAAIGRA